MCDSLSKSHDYFFQFMFKILISIMRMCLFTSNYCQTQIKLFLKIEYTFRLSVKKYVLKKIRRLSILFCVLDSKDFCDEFIESFVDTYLKTSFQLVNELDERHVSRNLAFEIIDLFEISRHYRVSKIKKKFTNDKLVYYMNIIVDSLNKSKDFTINCFLMKKNDVV